MDLRGVGVSFPDVSASSAAVCLWRRPLRLDNIEVTGDLMGETLGDWLVEEFLEEADLE